MAFGKYKGSLAFRELCLRDAVGFLEGKCETGCSRVVAAHLCYQTTSWYGENYCFVMYYLVPVPTVITGMYFTFLVSLS